MGFASAFINERALFPPLFEEAPGKDTGIIVVVPAYNEPGITMMLDSLLSCRKPGCGTEVIIIINAPDDASEESHDNNKKALLNIESWKRTNFNCFFRLFVYNASSHSISGWGVGLARKTGMDEAVRRFDLLNRPEGVILCLDADCTVAENYLTAVENELLKRKDRTACSIYFEHPIDNVTEVENITHITLYELHLRYYLQGLSYSGFPYAFHTVGSSLAVKALAYMMVGGMNRKQAGEDFYFIQKLVPSGSYFSLNSTTVFPSSRASLRVPFGTGASMDKLISENSSIYLTYSPSAFRELKVFFDLTDSFYDSNISGITDYYDGFPAGIRLFLDKDEWIEKINEIKNNTRGIHSFRKRFFDWFNMFKVVKYLNFVHTDYFQKIPAEIASSELLRILGVATPSEKPSELLLYYRQLEKSIRS